MSTAEWQDVSDLMQSQTERIHFGPQLTSLFQEQPWAFLSLLTQYKFAAKMIGKNRKILEIGCSEGLGSWILVSECGGPVLALDSDQTVLAKARQNWLDPRLEFQKSALTELPAEPVYDAVLALNLPVLLPEQNAHKCLQELALRLHSDAVAILGLSRECWSEFSAAVQASFQHHFIFSLNGEALQAGLRQYSERLLILACQPLSAQAARASLGEKGPSNTPI